MQRTEPEIFPTTFETLRDLCVDLRSDFLSHCFPNYWKRRVAEGNRRVRVKVDWSRFVRKLVRKWLDFGDDLWHFRRLALNGTRGINLPALAPLP